MWSNSCCSGVRTRTRSTATTSQLLTWRKGRRRWVADVALPWREKIDREREREFLHVKGICNLTFLCLLNVLKYAQAGRLHIPLYMHVLCRQGRVGHVHEVWCSKVQKCPDFPRTEAWFAGCVKGRESSLTAVAVHGLQVVWLCEGEVTVTDKSGCTWFAGCVKGHNRH